MTDSGGRLGGRGVPFWGPARRDASSDLGAPQVAGLAAVRWLIVAFAWAGGAETLAGVAGASRPAWLKLTATVLLVAGALVLRPAPARAQGWAVAVLLPLGMFVGTVAAGDPHTTVALLYGLASIYALSGAGWGAGTGIVLTVGAFAAGTVIDAAWGTPAVQVGSTLSSCLGLIVTCVSMQVLAAALRGQATAHHAELASTARLAAVVDHSPAAIVMVEADGRLATFNPAAEHLFGVSADHAPTNVLERILKPTRAPAGNQGSALPLLYSRVLAGETLHDQPLNWSHPDGRLLHLSASLVPVALPGDGEPAVLALINDVTEQRQMESLLRRQALTDELTGLANRNLFTDRLQHALAGRADRGCIAVLLVDLDGFKAVNDTGGHLAGDRLLRETAARLQSAVRRGDTVSRLGGDEFAILLQPTTPEAAAAVADSLVQTLRTTVRLPGGEEILLGASIGMTVIPPTWHGEVDQVLADADLAMYAAKHAGKNRWTAYAPPMRQAVADRLRLEAELRAALHNDQIVVHYQPYIDLTENRVVGFEALARWAHPTRGLLAPAEFIPLAEDTGLIVPLGRHILRQATQQLRNWQLTFPAHPPLTMSVNLSVRQLADPHLLSTVQQTLNDSNLSPRCLTLEITESLLAADDDDVVRVLGQLKHLGVRLAVDDFGTGFSALAYLQRFPIDVLKVDRSFVQKITGPEATPLTRSIIALAHSLHLATVAEGIETAEQAHALHQLGCDTAQGYHFARPQDAQQLTELLATTLPEPLGTATPAT